MPSAHRSDACRLARLSAVRITVVVRSQISVGSCSTQPACGRICSCSSWCRATSLPPWSKIMKRVLVVPWSTAPTKSATVRLHILDTVVRRRNPAHFLGLVRRQESSDQILVQTGADHTTDDRSHDRYPEVEIAGLISERILVPGEEAGQTRPEVTGRVYRIAGVGAPGHPDRDHQ